MDKQKTEPRASGWIASHERYGDKYYSPSQRVCEEKLVTEFLEIIPMRGTYSEHETWVIALEGAIKEAKERGWQIVPVRIVRLDAIKSLMEFSDWVAAQYPDTDMENATKLLLEEFNK